LDGKHSSSHSYWWIASKRSSLIGETWLQIIWQIGGTIRESQFCHQIQCQFSATVKPNYYSFHPTQSKGGGAGGIRLWSLTSLLLDEWHWGGWVTDWLKLVSKF
jgi:hypothetical protein